VIEPASAIGFALAFLGAAWTASAACGALVLAASSWLRRLGPAAERRAATCAILAGPALGVAIAGTLAARSLATPWFGWTDHCPAHGHHLHLCWFHGAAWGDVPWAVAALAAVGVVVAARVVLATIDAARARGAIRRIARVAVEIAPGVLLAPARRAFCFVAGGRVFVSSAAWDELDEAGRAAVVAHERAHLRRGDLRTRAWLGVAAILGAPGIARLMLAVWRRAAEKLCDRDAARAIGDEAAVAQALVTLSRLGGRSPGLAFVTARSEVEDRVEALLDSATDGTTAARRMAAIAAVMFVTTVAAAILLADPLHHAIETLFGGL
jgi:Zn-dependent protease with chaperone function